MDGKEESERRRELKKIYDRLMGENRIRFITFHQSFGYEEFIEGLRAETTDDGNVRYDIKPGIFKQICDDAAFGNAGALRTLDNALVQLQERLSEGESITLRTHNGNPFRVTYKSETAFGIFPSTVKKRIWVRAIMRTSRTFAPGIRITMPKSITFLMYEGSSRIWSKRVRFRPHLRSQQAVNGKISC